MATNFETNTISTNGGFMPTTTDTPLDRRSRVNSKADIESIPYPYIGMLIFVMEDDAYYKVLSLKSKTVGVLTFQNAAIDQYELAFSTKNADNSKMDAETKTAVEGINQQISGIDEQISGIDQKIIEINKKIGQGSSNVDWEEVD